MGEVYRARDSRLGRDVAIKVLSAARNSDASAQRRFEQEARAVALLSHPNILSIHHFDTSDGVTFAVTELLEGETLRDRIARSRLPWTKACDIAAVISDGLAAAHDKGIVHRDLKPANVFLTSDGQVKILDFGLARIAENREESREATDIKTSPGTIVGTLGYMSPEQLGGRQTDATTDIFALGCILYEMLSGKSPYVRATASETMAAVLRDEPADLPAGEAPAALMHLIRRCLQKDRNARYHSARDLGLDLRSLLVLPAATRRNTPIFILVAVVLAIVVAFVLTRKRPAAAAPHEIRSILVVPFENATRDPGAEYLSDGIAEGVTDKLAELPNLRVVARTTAFRFKGKPLDLGAIRKQLNVDAVLSGRLALAANAIVVQADLVDTAGGTELWGNRFHEQSANVLDIEQNMVGRISEALRVRLTPAQQTRISTPSTRNPEAYKLYLQGRYFWNKRTPEGVRKAIDLLEQAIAMDPQFALAYAGLADAYNISAGYYYLPSQTAGVRAEEAARTALRLDPMLAEAHTALGQFESNRFHWDPAEREFKKALEINPNYATALQWYALVVAIRGRIDESLRLNRRAEQIDPLSVFPVVNEVDLLEVKDDYAAALAAARKAMDLDSGYSWIYLQMGAAYEGLGQFENAAAMYTRGADVPGPPGFHEVFLARAAAVRGHRSEARHFAQQLERRAARGEVPPSCVAWIYAAAGDRDRAIEWFNRAFEVRDVQVRRSVRSPIVKELHGDPRYDALLRRIERGFED